MKTNIMIGPEKGAIPYPTKPSLHLDQFLGSRSQYSFGSR